MATKQREILLEKGTECLKIKATTPGMCKPLWDTIACWPETEPGQYQIIPCVDYFFGFDPKKNATRFCYENGTWHDWGNYTQCSDGPYSSVTEPFNIAINNSAINPEFLQVLADISIAGYTISMVSLIFAFSILASVKTLRSPRNILHMHLFLSFIMRAFMELLKQTLFVLSVGLPNNLVMRSGVYYFNVPREGIVWDCKLIFSIWQFFMLANYSWILMEAFYLHNLVFNALFSDGSSVTLYIILGWGLPLMVVIPWIICRIFFEDDLCWTLNKNTYIFAIIYVPVSASNIICFILFIRLVRVISTKLRSSVCEHTQIYRRLAKSTLTLIPLFGVHYIVFLAFDWYRYTNMELPVEMVLLFIEHLFTTFQGFIVALLYCFLNSEVRTELNKTHFGWPRRRRRNTDASDGKAFLSYSTAGTTEKKK